jgi:hypothetical protein
MATQNIYDFSDKLNIDRRSRETFVSEYVELLRDTMEDQDIISEWKRMVFEELRSEANVDGVDRLVQEAAEMYPKWMESQYNVDVSLAQV